MTEIEKMKRYIELTKMNKSGRFYLNMWEALELDMQTRETDNLALDAISLAFEYGKAKGYRAAKAEVRR